MYWSSVVKESSVSTLSISIHSVFQCSIVTIWMETQTTNQRQCDHGRWLEANVGQQYRKGPDNLLRMMLTALITINVEKIGTIAFLHTVYALGPAWLTLTQCPSFLGSYQVATLVKA